MWQNLEGLVTKTWNQTMTVVGQASDSQSITRPRAGVLLADGNDFPPSAYSSLIEINGGLPPCHNLANLDRLTPVLL